MQGIPALNVFLNVIIGVAAVISALVILLTMYTTVTERTRQIGIMKSLGMSNAKIAWTITQEAIADQLLRHRRRNLADDYSALYFNPRDDARGRDQPGSFWPLRRLSA